jgi:ferredoxin
MRVWIDGEQCTGVALCEQACPEVFAMAPDGIAHVLDAAGQMLPDKTAAPFANELLESVLEAAEGCPEECIFIEE